MILGVDVSAHQEDLEEGLYDRLDAHGCQFLFARASRGTVPDLTLERHLTYAVDRGWLHGAYHFLERPEEHGTGAAQAAVFLDSLRTFGDWTDSLPVLDVEVDGLKWMQMVEWVERVRQAGFAKVGVYTRESWWQEKFPERSRDSLFDFEWMAVWDQSRRLSTWDTVPHDSDGLVQFGALVVAYGGKSHKIDGNLFSGNIADFP